MGQHEDVLLPSPTPEIQPCGQDVGGLPTMQVIHEEPAATIDAEVAESDAQARWVEQVEERIRASKNDIHGPRRQEDGGEYVEQENSEHEDSPDEKVYLLRYGCNATEAFRDILLSGPHLRICRESLMKEGYSCILPSGALIFVPPEHFSQVCEQLRSHELRPFNIVISTRFEGDMENALASFSYKKRPREKRKDRREIHVAPPSVSEPVNDSDYEPGETCSDRLVYLCEARTFICSCSFRKSASAVAQSTTEAITESAFHYAYSRGTNPRRVV